MKEITRIHIAKVAYDIELPAKKELESYLKELGLYVGDEEVMQDVEVRMTELLGERGISSGGVIVQEDVQALRKQLGEPKDFASEEQSEVHLDEGVVVEGKRVYRDTDGAILAGVLAGFARFFGIDPLWTRLIFIVLLIGSFGTAMIVYLILWVVLPPARTTAEKLRMQGKPVTLASIREQSALDEDTPKNKSPEMFKKILLFAAGLASAVMALCALITTVGGVIVVQNLRDIPWSAPGQVWGWTALGLFVASGLLLTALGILWSYAAFSKTFTKKYGIATAIIMLLGIASFGAGVGVIVAGEQLYMRDIQNAMKESRVDLPSEFSNVKRLVVMTKSADSVQYYAGDVSVEYIVDSGTPRYELTALPGAKPQVTVDGDTAQVTFGTTNVLNMIRWQASPRLVIYGPALDAITNTQGSVSYTSGEGQSQAKIQIESSSATDTTLHGRYEEVSTSGSGAIDLTASSVADLRANMSGGSVRAGVVRTLVATQPDVCPSSYEPVSQIEVQGVSSGEITHNGQAIAARTIDAPCYRVQIGEDE